MNFSTTAPSPPKSYCHTFISTLRRKVDADALALIRTVRGFGYTIRSAR